MDDRDSLLDRACDPCSNVTYPSISDGALDCSHSEDKMNRSLIFCMVMGVLALRPEVAVSQQKSFKDELIGSWTIVSNDNIGVNGEKRQIFGPNPKGLFILGADERYALVVVNPDRPKFKGTSRLEGTP